MKNSTVEDRIRGKLIRAGLHHIHDFGYPEATEETIISDIVYGKFFLHMLLGTMEEGKNNPMVIRVCESIISEIKNRGEV